MMAVGKVQARLAADVLVPVTEIKKLRRALFLSRRIAHKSILPCEGAFFTGHNVGLQFSFQEGGNLHQVRGRDKERCY
jgi:hypothetical protein